MDFIQDRILKITKGIKAWLIKFETFNTFSNVPIHSELKRRLPIAQHLF
jgi:hypothetical protein